MKKIDIGQTIGVLANIGILVSIVFLAIEIGQNQETLEEQNTLTKLSGRDAAIDRFGEWRRLLLQNPELHRVWLRGLEGQELEPFEQAQFQAMVTEWTYLLLTLHNRFSALGVDPEARGMVTILVEQIESSETFRRLWDGRRDFIIERGYDGFVNDVDLALQLLSEPD